MARTVERYVPITEMNDDEIIESALFIETLRPYFLRPLRSWVPPDIYDSSDDEEPYESDVPVGQEVVTAHGEEGELEEDADEEEYIDVEGDEDVEDEEDVEEEVLLEEEEELEEEVEVEGPVDLEAPIMLQRTDEEIDPGKPLLGSTGQQFYCCCSGCKNYISAHTPIRFVDPFEVEMKSRRAYFERWATNLSEDVLRDDHNTEMKFNSPITPPPDSD